MRHQIVVLAPGLRPPAVHLEQRHRVQRLLADTDEVAAHAAVDDPLLGDDVEVPVHLKDPDPRCDDDGLLASPVQVPVDEMFLEGVERNVENLQEVSLGSRGEPSLRRGNPRPGMVVDDELETSPC